MQFVRAKRDLLIFAPSRISCFLSRTILSDPAKSKNATFVARNSPRSYHMNSYRQFICSILEFRFFAWKVKFFLFLHFIIYKLYHVLYMAFPFLYPESPPKHIYLYSERQFPTIRSYATARTVYSKNSQQYGDSAPLPQ